MNSILSLILEILTSMLTSTIINYILDNKLLTKSSKDKVFAITNKEYRVVITYYFTNILKLLYYVEYHSKNKN